MPGINARSTSGLDPRCFGRPAEPLRGAMPNARVGHGPIPRVGQWIARARNVPRPSMDQAHANRWVVRAKRVPTSIRHDPVACHAHLQPVLLAIAAVHSDYWHQSLGGRALCVRHDDGSVACRISQRKNGGMDMRGSDVVVQLTEDGPRAYDAAQCRTLPATYQSELFCAAAAQAAQLLMSRLTGLSTDHYNTVIARHEAKLNASMVKWIQGNKGDLDRVTALMMKPESPADI